MFSNQLYSQIGDRVDSRDYSGTWLVSEVGLVSVLSQIMCS
jgi:hypothetical protein